VLPLPTVVCAGIPVVVTNPADACRWLIAEAVDRRERPPGRGLGVHLCNSYVVSLTSRSEAYRAHFLQDCVNLPDGVPLAWVVRRVKGMRGARAVRGPALMTSAMEQGRPYAIRHALIGGGEDLQEKLKARLRAQAPGVDLALCLPLPYAEDLTHLAESVAEQINATQADLAWIGLGTPKQDLLVAALIPLVSCPVLAVGAALDFAAGTKKEAPRWVHDSGFEWLFRLVTEPRRLWRRYLVGNVVFMFAVVRGQLSDRRASRSATP
jgi:N-acetylglucosaminyldiphosphoundecaprenol N-acetyl-beta-D-mannosaminyltransferase